MKKVFVSGCFDLLHSGHISFLKEAAQYGDLYVSIASDKTILELKKRKAFYPEQERLFMVKAIRHVHDAYISSGSGLLDFQKEMERVKPDIFFINSDGDTPQHRKLMKERNIQYIISERKPSMGLSERSTTSIRNRLLKENKD